MHTYSHGLVLPYPTFYIFLISPCPHRDILLPASLFIFIRPMGHQTCHSLPIIIKWTSFYGQLHSNGDIHVIRTTNKMASSFHQQASSKNLEALLNSRCMHELCFFNFQWRPGSSCRWSTIAK